MAALQSPQPPSTDALLRALLNELSTLPNKLILVLDDYHLIDSQVIATREDPQLPPSRLRVRDQLSEVRAADLRVTPGEAVGFLNQMMKCRTEHSLPHSEMRLDANICLTDLRLCSTLYVRVTHALCTY